MRITDLILICVYFIWNLSSVSCLFFHIGETERKCFIEEVPEDTIVNINYKVELYDPKTRGFMQPSLGIGMHVEVKDPDGTIVLSRVYSMEGKVSFTSNLAGEHSLCLYSNATKWFGGSQLRIHLNIEVGEHDLSENMLPQKDKLNDLQKKLLHLLQQVDQISSEQNYQRFREEKFRQLSESTNSRVLWWSLLQIILLISMGAWQMRHLKSFFEAKKLV